MDIFLKEGLVVIKVPLSGRGQPMPDLIVARKGVLYGFEVKLSIKPKAKFMERDYDNLIEWLMTLKHEGIPVRAYLAVKVGDKWLFEEIDRDRREVAFPSDGNISLEEMLSILKGRKRYSKKLDCTIRLMGTKEDVYEITAIIQDILKRKGYETDVREYVMYKNKKERTEVDVTKTRVYIRVKGIKKKKRRKKKTK